MSFELDSPAAVAVDRNKTELTQNITRNVVLWLDGKGFKPVETEVGVDRGWIADVAGVCCPTQTELIELKLIKRAPRWTYDDHAAFDAWKEQRNAIPSPLTALVEVKASRSDYRGDRKWGSLWPTNLCYVAMPEGMIDAKDWPSGWGAILFSQDGSTVRRVYPPKIHPVTTAQHLSVVLALAVARDHRTRHAHLREMQRRVRVEDGERKSIVRVTKAIALVREVMKGKPVDEALRRHGIKERLPEHILNDLKSLSPSSPQ